MDRLKHKTNSNLLSANTHMSLKQAWLRLCFQKRTPESNMFSFSRDEKVTNAPSGQYH